MDLRLRIEATRPSEPGMADRLLWDKIENGRFQECVKGIGFDVTSSISARRSSRQGVLWRRPSEEWWKLNSDCAVATGSGLSSCGGVGGVSCCWCWFVMAGMLLAVVYCG
ncbi:hypothetical protein V6N12_069301 [Hibiscus sabdariffa]|uniref:Uncharacterized protein n=1 Tax=Hibiscus sabdariffa TaxID=183260 RepID=A0ABR2FDU3_9ROSI